MFAVLESDPAVFPGVYSVYIPGPLVLRYEVSADSNAEAIAAGWILHLEREDNE